MVYITIFLVNIISYNVLLKSLDDEEQIFINMKHMFYKIQSTFES